MLTSLSIRNVVLIDKLDLDFKSGLSVLTGETGAGKSILLDSLGLLLGNRAETGLIRQGEEKLSVIGTFTLPKNQEFKRLLDEYDLEVEDDVIIKRSLSQDGKGKIFLNDQQVSVKVLKEIGRFLVEVHGQFDNQGLLNPANHLDILDAYGNYKEKLETVMIAYNCYKQAKNARTEAEKNILKAKEDEENLRHWVDELRKMNVQENEEEILSQRRQELMNAEKIVESINYAYGALTQGADVQGALRQAQNAIDKVNILVNDKYKVLSDMLEQAAIDVSESVNELEELASGISMNQNELESIEERLFALRGIARKHQSAIADLPQILQKFEQQLQSLECGEEGLNNLRREEEQAKLNYIKEANTLSSCRQQAAQLLDKQVMAELKPLKMEKAKFTTVVEKEEESSWGIKGFDNVMFTVSTNPNSPQGPLNKIASGGELARFMLALKVNLAQSSQIGTMIFDEVDAGVGGATAQAVGERLARLAQTVQVLVVTHSPQVAARGNHHFKVEKTTENNVTTTGVKELNDKERHEEVARMLAGETITDEARAAAKVLIEM
ncbi:MAG: DNA repair protein RecN [Alphaproteobacteria bacterium]|nr:DNA repair protein RecN [Alphaproteobacteria bacterium]